jgi:hypothetical protein
MRRGAAVLATVAAAAAFTGASAAPAKGPRLSLSEKSVVPGQVLVAKAKGVSLKRAKAKVGGKRADVVKRSKRRVRVVVPHVKPGKTKLVIRAQGHRLAAPLRVREGFDGSLEAELDDARAASAEISRSGGSLEVTGANGTRFTLMVPERALAEATRITMTPVAKLEGFPLSGKPLGVDLAPDGLEFGTPATLRIVRPKGFDGELAGFTYEDAESGLDLQRPERSGDVITISIAHFSGAGASTINERDFFALIGRLILEDLNGTLDFADVAEFARALSVFAPAFNFNCADNSTCAWLFGLAVDAAEDHVDGYQCLGQGEVHGSLRINRIIEMLEADATLRRLNINVLAARIESVRQCETENLVLEIADAARSDPLEATHVAPISSRDQARAGYNNDRVIANCEWAVYVAEIAAQQGFTGAQRAATQACEAGLQPKLEEGIARCDVNVEEGRELLDRALHVAANVRILATEFAQAREGCRPKIVITPSPATVQTDAEQTFSARSNYGETSFQWSTSDGQIDQSGKFTAPHTPGPETITASSNARSGVTGTATVTIVCPPGKVEFQGECRTITVTISPTSASLEPGGVRQFTATVSNTIDTRVDWHASGGALTQAGRYTAPQEPGEYTVTAVSRADPSKFARATVNVGDAEVEIVPHPGIGPPWYMEIGALAAAGDDMQGENCGNGDSDSTEESFSGAGPWSPSRSASASAASGAADPGFECPPGNATANASLVTDNDWSVEDGQLSASFAAEGGAAASSSGSGEGWGFAKIGAGLWFEVTGHGTLTLTCTGDFPAPHGAPGEHYATAHVGGYGVTVTGNGFADHEHPSFSVTLNPSEHPGQPPDWEIYALGFGFSEEARTAGDSGSASTYSEMSVTCSTTP